MIVHNSLSLIIVVAIRVSHELLDCQISAGEVDPGGGGYSGSDGDVRMR